MSAERTVYFICHDEIETEPLKNPVDYSEKELIKNYWNRSFVDYDQAEEFSSYEEAKAEFDKMIVSDPYLKKTSYGYYYLLYSIVFIQKVDYDEDGEIEYIEELDQKTGSYTADHEV